MHHGRAPRYDKTRVTVRVYQSTRLCSWPHYRTILSKFLYPLPRMSN